MNLILLVVALVCFIVAAVLLVTGDHHGAEVAEAVGLAAFAASFLPGPGRRVVE